MRLIYFALALLSISSIARGVPPEPLTVKSISCASGTLHRNRTVGIGQFIPPTIIHEVTKEIGAVVETKFEAVLTVKVEGGEYSVCANDGKETILTIVLSK